MAPVTVVFPPVERMETALLALKVGSSLLPLLMTPLAMILPGPAKVSVWNPVFMIEMFALAGDAPEKAAAEAKATLVSLAATRLGVSVENLTVARGIVSARDDAKKQVSYSDLMGVCLSAKR